MWPTVCNTAMPARSTLKRLDVKQNTRIHNWNVDGDKEEPKLLVEVLLQLEWAKKPLIPAQCAEVSKHLLVELRLALAACSGEEQINAARRACHLIPPG